MSALGLDMSGQPGDERPGSGGGGPHGRRPRRGGLAVLLALVLVLVLGGAAFAGLGRLTGALGGGAEDFPGPGSGEAVVQVEPGDNATEVGERLERAGVVASSRAFATAARQDARSANLQPGFYALRRQMRASDALGRLFDPAARVQSRVTVPEGLRLDQTLRVLAEGTDLPERDLERAARSGDIGLPAYSRGRAEGFLYPATYAFAPGVKPEDVLREMTRTYAPSATRVGVERHPRFSPYEIVTIASLVEEEARRPEDFGRVARVIYNRLDRRMPLQLDSTVNYVLKTDKDVVFKKDIEQASSPYNTYENPGLPPGPISSPGERALAAAVNPPAGKDLYFVTVDLESGETKYAEKYEDFLELKAELKRNQRRT